MQADVNPVARAARMVARSVRIAEQECLSEGFGVLQHRVLLFAKRRAGDLASRAALTRRAVTAPVNVARTGRAASARTERRLATRLARPIGRSKEIGRVLSGLPAVEHPLDRAVEREITARRIEARPLVARR